MKPLLNKDGKSKSWRGYSPEGTLVQREEENWGGVGEKEQAGTRRREGEKHNMSQEQRHRKGFTVRKTETYRPTHTWKL